jgi:hypothetical protein
LKWTPALAGVLLAIWLLAVGRRRDAARYAALLAGTFFVIHLPFLVIWPREVLAAYDLQAGRGLTPESIFYVVLRPLGLAEFPDQIWSAADVPSWANPAAALLQALALLALVAVVVRVKSLEAAVAVAGLGPIVFLLMNRVFSPQFFVVFVAVWAICGSLLARSSGDQLRFGLVIFGGTLANVLVYPSLVPQWGIFSALVFLFGLVASGWVLVRASTEGSLRAQGSLLALGLLKANKLGTPRALRILTAGIVALLFVVLASSTAATESVLSRVPEYGPVLRLLPRYEGQSGDPDLRHLRTTVDVDAIRRAGELAPDDAPYYVQAREPLLEDIRRVARLYFLPSVEVRRATDAEWILVFRSGAPPRVQALESIALSGDVSLLRVRSSPS